MATADSHSWWRAAFNSLLDKPYFTAVLADRGWLAIAVVFRAQCCICSGVVEWIWREDTWDGVSM